MIGGERAYPQFSVKFERDMEEIHTLVAATGPDEGWRFVDKKGHGHFWQGELLPTLEWVVTGSEWIGDDWDAEEIEVGEWRCKQCGETVKPGRRTLPNPTLVPGLAWFMVRFGDREYRLTPDMYADSVEAWEKHIQGVSAR